MRNTFDTAQGDDLKAAIQSGLPFVAAVVLTGFAYWYGTTDTRFGRFVIGVRTTAVLMVGTLAWLAFVGWYGVMGPIFALAYLAGWYRRRTVLLRSGVDVRRDPRAFGQTASGSSVAGLDGPMIGAASMVLVDGLVESESGQTPAPPAVSVKGLAIGLVAMFIFGVLGALIAYWLHVPLVVGPHG